MELTMPEPHIDTADTGRPAFVGHHGVPGA
jgi:hypothetical protein